MLIAAVDPAAEAKLDGLNHAVTSGQYLPENYRRGAIRMGPFPVLAAADSGVGEYSVTQVQELAVPRRAAGAGHGDDAQGLHGGRARGAQH